MSAKTMEVQLGYDHVDRSNPWGPWGDSMGTKHYFRPDGIFPDFKEDTQGRDTPAELNYLGHFAAERQSVTVPAGHFEDCHVMIESAGARNYWAHWLCPGVGFVRHELSACSGGDDGGFAVYELIDYHVPPIISVP
jgi:hypothetical protein